MSPPIPSAEHPSRSRQDPAVELQVRRELARELHDRVAQTLTGMLVDVENFKLQQVEWGDVVRQMDMVQTSTRQVLTSLRQLIHDLRGESQLSDNFVESLGNLIARFQEKTRISAELDVRPGWPQALTGPASLNLYRIVEEALFNVRMHSHARSVRIVLESQSEGELVLVVDDDGRGLDTSELRPEGMGTIGMRERALFLGGRLKIQSEPGFGTVIVATFPREHLVPLTADLSA